MESALGCSTASECSVVDSSSSKIGFDNGVRGQAGPLPGVDREGRLGGALGRGEVKTD